MTGDTRIIGYDLSLLWYCGVFEFRASYLRCKCSSLSTSTQDQWVGFFVLLCSGATPSGGAGAGFWLCTRGSPRWCLGGSYIWSVMDQTLVSCVCLFFGPSWSTIAPAPVKGSFLLSFRVLRVKGWSTCSACQNPVYASEPHGLLSAAGAAHHHTEGSSSQYWCELKSEGKGKES